MVVRRRDGKKPTLPHTDNNALKLSSNIMSVIFAILAICLLVYGTTTLGKVFAGMAIMAIPLVRLFFTTIMVTDEAIDIAKVSNKNLEKLSEHTKEVMEIAEIAGEIADEKDKIINELTDLLRQGIDVIDYLRDEVRPLNLDIKNKGDVIVTLVEAEKIKVTYGNQSDYATPESLGMVDKKKNASLYWVWMKLFCELSGYMNFNLNYDYSDKKEKDRIHQQLSRFRKRLGEAFGFEIESSDYKFNNGEWTWKTINWRDEFSTHQQIQHRQELVETMKDAKTGADLKSVRQLGKHRSYPTTSEST
jgi:hypothetical protein